MLYHDAGFSKVNVHSTEMVLFFIWMRCGTGYGTGRVRSFVLFGHGTRCGTGVVWSLVLFQS